MGPMTTATFASVPSFSRVYRRRSLPSRATTMLASRAIHISQSIPRGSSAGAATSGALMVS